MQDINQGEKDRLYQWACDNHSKELEEKYFTKIDRKCKSYFEKRSYQDLYYIEYSYQTMPEIKSELDAMWENDDVMENIEKVVLVASMKNKPKLEKELGEDQNERMEQLKPFIYNF